MKLYELPMWSMVITILGSMAIALFGYETASAAFFAIGTLISFVLIPITS